MLDSLSDSDHDDDAQQDGEALEKRRFASWASRRACCVTTLTVCALFPHFTRRRANQLAARLRQRHLQRTHSTSPHSKPQEKRPQRGAVALVEDSDGIFHIVDNPLRVQRASSATEIFGVESLKCYKWISPRKAKRRSCQHWLQTRVRQLDVSVTAEDSNIEVLCVVVCCIGFCVRQREGASHFRLRALCQWQLCCSSGSLCPSLLFLVRTCGLNMVRHPWESAVGRVA